MVDSMSGPEGVPRLGRERTYCDKGLDRSRETLFDASICLIRFDRACSYPVGEGYVRNIADQPCADSTLLF